MDTSVPTKEEVEALIYEAFADVRLGDGISWSDAEEIDRCFPPEERKIRCALDDEAPWQNLVDDPNWIISRRGGGFAFLDPGGYTYYLPAVMVRILRGREDGLRFFTNLNPTLFPGESADYMRSQWTELNDRQCHAVAAFIRYMIRIDEKHGEGWLKAYLGHWNQFYTDPLK